MLTRLGRGFGGGRVAVQRPVIGEGGRVPADGVVTRLAYRAGTFFNAALDKASELNERQSVRMTLPDARELGRRR